jgi:uncharacterized membrane protein HdeD (DUF308 family)
MTTQVKAKVSDGVKSAAPWRKGIAWWLVLVEGIVLLGIGLYMVLDHQGTGVMLGKLVAAVLGIMGLLELIAGLRLEASGAVIKVTMIHATVGLVTGLLIFVLLWTDAMTNHAGAVILSVGCLIFGLLGLYRVFLLRGQAPLRGSLITSVFFFFFGAVLMLSALGKGLFDASLTLMAWLLVIAGALLIAWAILLYRRIRAESAAQ